MPERLKIHFRPGILRFNPLSGIFFTGSLHGENHAGCSAQDSFSRSKQRPSPKRRPDYFQSILCILRGCMKGPQPLHIPGIVIVAFGSFTIPISASLFLPQAALSSDATARHARCEERLQAASDIIFWPCAKRTRK